MTRALAGDLRIRIGFGVLLKLHETSKENVSNFCHAL